MYRCIFYLLVEILSGRYADDFEPDDDESDEFRSSAEENSADESPTQSKYRKPVVSLMLSLFSSLEMPSM